MSLLLNSSRLTSAQTAAGTVIGFTDGDGNGLAQADTLAPFCPTCEHHQNLRIPQGEILHGWKLTQPDAGQIPFYRGIPWRPPVKTLRKTAPSAST